MVLLLRLSRKLCRMVRSVLRKVGVLVALVCGTLFFVPSAYAVGCVDPGPIATSITNDAAIEVHGLRRETADNCAATLESLTALKDRMDLIWWGIWAIVGVTLGTFAGAMIVNSFRFWEGDNG